MESTLCLHCRPLPFLAQRIPSAVRTRATSPHFSFKHSSLLLSDGFTSHQRRRTLFSPIIKQKTLSVRASAIPPGGKAALQSFLDMTANLTSSNEDFQKLETFKLPQRPSTEDVGTLKMKALLLLRSGKGDEAEEILKKALKVCKNDPEPAYNLEIALAEILICKKKYGEAHTYLKHQLHPSDGRFPLYKAITCTMLDNEEEGKEWWDKFSLIVEGGFDIPIKGELEY
ncbi:uncharacterized protein LOC121264003 [Juglans microcarpa x Juglans regia]|uniref:uncharacterized protein LOC121264003 n=1 Tax=Juglans microcarpa x Juglans regia TaxID=2249226 RepID=UPI001B7E566C|nr:uncharacterized protein LOC121264003 [Juglans microcarpa x Juglans regia]